MAWEMGHQVALEDWPGGQVHAGWAGGWVDERSGGPGCGLAV